LLRNDSVDRDTGNTGFLAVLNAGTPSSSWVYLTLGSRQSVVAIPTSDGAVEVQWEIPSEWPIGLPVVSANGTIYYFTTSGAVERFGSDGTKALLHLRYPVISTMFDAAVLLPSGPVDLGDVWFVSTIGTFNAVAAFTGDLTLQWTLETTFTRPIIDVVRRTVRVSSFDGDHQHVAALDLATGALLWNQSFSSPQLQQASWQGMTSTGTIIFLGNPPNYNYATAVSANGSIAWTKTLPDGNRAVFAAIDAEDRIMFCCTLQAFLFDGNTGLLLANSTDATCADSQTLAVANGAFASSEYVGGNVERFFGLSFIPS
jgi:outer membrane protein assembly factor BamB